MRSLRARAFVAIAVAVLAAVGVTLVVAAALVRHSVRDDALASLVRQTELIAQEQRAQPGGPSSLGQFFQTKRERLAIVSVSQAALLLPADAAEALREGRTARGSVEIGGRGYL